MSGFAVKTGQDEQGGAEHIEIAAWVELLFFFMDRQGGRMIWLEKRADEQGAKLQHRGMRNVKHEGQTNWNLDNDWDSPALRMWGVQADLTRMGEEFRSGNSSLFWCLACAHIINQS